MQPRGEEGVANVQQRGWGVDGHHRRSSRPQAQRARTSPSTAATHLDGPRRSLFSYAGSFAPRAVCPGSAERQPPRRVPSSRPVGRASVPGSSMRGCGYAADRLPFAFGGGLPLARISAQPVRPYPRRADFLAAAPAGAPSATEITPRDTGTADPLPASEKASSLAYQRMTAPPALRVHRGYIDP